MNLNDIFSYIRTQESMYHNGVQINDVWIWSMKDHITRSMQYTYSQLFESPKTSAVPVKNITRPILNLQHRTEDIEVKEAQIYVDDPDKYHLSFLVKKYHDDVFVPENHLDTFFDELNVSRIDYGGGLSKLTANGREVVPLQSIAFCDQTDMLSGPIGIKHYYSPDQLMEMSKVGWGEESNGATISLEQLITLSRNEKKDVKDGVQTKTPGRYIEVYEVHGNLPESFADAKANPLKYKTRLFICAFYQPTGNSKEQGVILYTAPEKKTPFKLIKRDPVYGRALGFGGAEELFDSQIWTNYDIVRMQNMLESASATILQHIGVTPLRQTTLKGVSNLEIVEIPLGEQLAQVDTFPRNLKVFENAVAEWEAHAQQMGAANDSIMGQPPTAGTPFKLQELVTNESHGLHDYRRGQYAQHLEEIYRDDWIPQMEREIVKGSKFLSELSLEDLQYVRDCMVRVQTDQFIKGRVLNGEVVHDADIAFFKDKVTTEFSKKGNKHFIEILKGEFKDAPLAVKVSVAGKSKNLAGMVDKITNIFRFAFSNPQGFAQVIQIPGMAKSFNEILEFSGMSPADFTGIEKLAQPPAPQQPQISPMQPQMNQPQNA